jgi:WD40 repeat protein
MAMVIDPIAEIECEAVVSAAAIAPDAKWLAWGSEDGVVRIVDLSTSEPMVLDPFNVDDSVSHLAIAAGDVIVVGTHTSDLHGHERLGGRRWSHSLGGGCDHLHISSDGGLVASIDGGRHLHLLTENGVNRGRFTASELIRLCVSEDGTKVAVADDEGNVTVLSPSGEKLYGRETESEMDETISAMCFLHDGSLLLCREALGLTQAEVPQIALERWQDGVQLHIEEVDSRSVVLVPDGTGALAGQFDGTVLCISDDLQSEVRWKSMYTVNDIQRYGSDLLVASWFHLHRISSDGEHLWQCEHTGLVQSIITSKDGSRILLTGDNQNDYTRENRMLLLDPEATPYVLSEDFDIDEDLQEFVTEAPIAAPDEELYADDEETIASLLTEEERGLMHKRHEVDEELFDMLDDEIEQLAMVQDDTPDLFTNLDDEDFVSHVPPSADAGQDQIVSAKADGTATVLLDGAASSAGTQGIEQWIWRDGDSKQIGKEALIRVRLPVGNHTFTLTVSDPSRESSTDTVTVQVQGTAVDDTFDLLSD